jgi:hypothetical protein
MLSNPSTMATAPSPCASGSAFLQTPAVTLPIIGTGATRDRPSNAGITAHFRCLPWRRALYDAQVTHPDRATA